MGVVRSRLGSPRASLPELMLMLPIETKYYPWPHAGGIFKAFQVTAKGKL